MRRAEKEIRDFKEMERILRSATVCTLALWDGDRAYSLPMNFGYRDRALYFHSARVGRKVEILKKQPQAGFSVIENVSFAKNENICNWGTCYESITGSGDISFIEDLNSKAQALQIIVEQLLQEKSQKQFNLEAITKTLVFKLEIKEMSGKKSG